MHKEVQGTEKITSYEALEDKKRSRCRPGLKRVGATCCAARSVVKMALKGSICDDLNRAAYYIQTLPQRIAEVEAAAEAVYETARRQGR
jgi:hypothetical protein